MPIYRFLKLVNPARHDVLLLNDPSRAHYARGIPSLANSLDELAGALRQFQRQRGYRQVKAFGTSAGGLAAIIVACQNQWAKAIAVGADNPASHEVLEAMLGPLALAAGKVPDMTQVVVAYAGRNARDLAAAAEISRRIPNVQHHPDARFSQHNILEELHQRSELSAFLSKLLC